MDIRIVLGLLAASVPLTAFILKLISMVSPVQFVKLETHFELFREEVRRELDSIRKILEKNDEK